MSDCLFCKIAAGEIPADIVYQDDVCLAFRDIHPAAPQHLLLIPRRHLATMNDLDDAALAGHLLTVVPRLARQLGIADGGYRTVVNCNADAGQEVFHLHVHLLGGRRLSWPPG
ncbi:MAG: histidine triad nucleotide-binding protein [Deltaproteobacteria bacterium]|nr:MAG: histidine triad nucleotide-binding protein [Deltaproteobacteria bacterium]